MSDVDPRAASLLQTREHGLWGRADSPPEWQAALDGATPGDPVLVRSPDDRRDDFYLVPMRQRNSAARSAWVILDRETLKLREASLLDHWPAPAFPDEKDRNRLSHTPLVLPDGTRARFSAEELRPNLKNLVWKPTEAAILPYWPVKEFIAAHPLTREPVSIYLTQDGNILTDLDREEPQYPSSPPAVRMSLWGVGLMVTLVLSVALTALVLRYGRPETPVKPAAGERVKSIPTVASDTNTGPGPVPGTDTETDTDEVTSSGNHDDGLTDDERKLWEQIEVIISQPRREEERVRMRLAIRTGLNSLRDKKRRLGYLRSCLKELQGIRSQPPDAEPAPATPSR